MFLKWGVVKENGEVVIHRTLLKVLLNPLLTKFGWIIVSKFEGDEFLGYEMRWYPENCSGPFSVWFKIGGARNGND